MVLSEVVMNYYEFSQPVMDRFDFPKYIKLTGNDNHVWAHVYRHGTNLTQMAERIWREDVDGVRFVKNRFVHAADVDMKEFMWIKLKC